MFFLDKEGRLYRRSHQTNHHLVVLKEDRTWMMKSAHDDLGHCGLYVTKTLLEQRFYWPEMERDVKEYVKSCHACQLRQKQLPWALPTVTYTPSIFTEFHMDTLYMSVSSNRCKKIAHRRCALTAWPEARVIKAETA